MVFTSLTFLHLTLKWNIPTAPRSTTANCLTNLSTCWKEAANMTQEQVIAEIFEGTAEFTMYAGMFVIGWLLGFILFHKITNKED